MTGLVRAGGGDCRAGSGLGQVPARSGWPRGAGGPAEEQFAEVGPGEQGRGCVVQFDPAGDQDVASVGALHSLVCALLDEQDGHAGAGD